MKGMGNLKPIHLIEIMSCFSLTTNVFIDLHIEYSFPVFMQGSLPQAEETFLSEII